MGQQKSKIGRVTDFADAEDFVSGPGSDVAHDPAHDRGFATFSLDDEGPYRLDKGDARYPVWSGLLRQWPAYDLPIYVEAEDDSGLVGKLIIPDVKRIAAVQHEPHGGRLRVVPHATPIFYYLSTDHPRYDDLRAVLEQAAQRSEPVLVFIDPESPLNDDRIIDVRISEVAAEAVKRAEEEGGGAPPFPDGLPNGGLRGMSTDEPAAVMGAPALASPRPFITAAEAEALFDDLRNNHAIPFCYIRDCCKARAHKMCHVIRGSGVAVAKVWNYGNGTLDTPDPEKWEATLSIQTPQGPLWWLFHTAPLVDVELAGGEVIHMVFDPAMFDHPVQVEEWCALQSDHDSRVRVRDARYYWFSPDDVPGARDDNLAETELRLLAHLAKCV